MFFITHGHIYNEEKLPLLNQGDILIHGHTHIPAATDRGDYFFFNPGSVSLPKEDSKNSYMIYKDGNFNIKDFDENIIKSLKI
jgi:putative phosphoesterase